jgi:hypothetical protein
MEDQSNAGSAPVERPVRPLLERLRDVQRDGMTFAGEAADEIERLRAALEVSEAATAGAIRAAQWQARTNAELNRLQDEVRRLRSEACRRLNDEFGA